MLSARLHILSLLLLVNTFAFAQTIRYVTPNGTNTNPATAISWAASTTDLQGAINASQAGDQVWVAGGIYKPGGNANTNRWVSFSMKNGVAIYGGFAGNETALNQRPATNPVNGQPSSSTLSGEIGDPNSTTDNSYHVISNSGGLTTTAVLDGFVITRGNADQAHTFPHYYGGGVFNDGASSFCNPTLRNCTFLRNSAYESGGAIFNRGTSAGNCSPVLANCLFQANSASLGGAIYNRAATDGIGGGTSNPIVTNCSFFSNSASSGGAVFNRGIDNGSTCNPVFTNCTFQSNFASSQGGAVYNSADYNGINNLTLTNCTFQSNVASAQGGAIYNNTYNSNSRPILTSCAFLNNSARYNGGGIYTLSSSGSCNPLLVNCSFQGNTAASTGGVICNISSSGGTINLAMTNCIVFGNGRNSTFYNYLTTIAATYCYFESIAMSGESGIGTIDVSGPGNIITTATPFAAKSSVGLATCSPAINAGNAASITTESGSYSALTLPAIDLIGNPRIFGGKVDMGAVEYQQAPSQCVTRLYVRANANGSKTGLDWGNAFTDLQDAISYPNSLSLTEIWVAAGTYKPDGSTNTDRTRSFSMKNGVTIYGGFIGNETSLSQRPAINPLNGQPSSSTLSGEIGEPNSTTDNSYHVINNPVGLTTTAVLDGFVVTGGNANKHAYPDGNGGGVFNDGLGTGHHCNPTFRSCSFIYNSADQGGAMYNRGASYGNSSPRLFNCLFQNNTAGYNGGAIFNNGDNNGNSSPVLSNSHFISNSATAEGGAIINDGGNSSPTLTNCAFHSNRALKGGAIRNVSSVTGNSSATLTGCSFIKNSASSQGGALHNGGGASGVCQLVLVNCSFIGNLADYQGSAMYNLGYQSLTNPSLINCILFNNGGSNALYFYGNSGTITATYSLFEPSAVSGVSGLDLSGPGNLTNITVSPFASTTSVALAPNSPAINAGDPSTSSATVGMTDLADNPRFVGRIDMGALEFQGILEIYTLKNGNWNDPSVWSLSRMPQPGERVRLRHTVTIPAGFTASGLILSYDPDGRLIHEAGSRLQLGN